MVTWVVTVLVSVQGKRLDPWEQRMIPYLLYMGVS